MKRYPTVLGALLVPLLSAGCGDAAPLSEPAVGRVSHDGSITVTSSVPEDALPLNLAVAAQSGSTEPCEGNNHVDDYLNHGITMGGPMVGIAWTPAVSVTVRRIEVLTGRIAAPNALAIWSDDGGSPAGPAAPIGMTGIFTTTTAIGWQGANLLSPVSVAAGDRYWVVWDPAGGEQASVGGVIQQSYWGSYSGTVEGGANWFGPFSSSSNAWKFRMYCGPAAPADRVVALINSVAELGADARIDQGVAQALTKKLENGLASIEQNESAAAVGQLGAFINQVRALAGRKVPPDVARAWIAEAEAVIAQLRQEG